MIGSEEIISQFFGQIIPNLRSKSERPLTGSRFEVEAMLSW